MNASAGRPFSRLSGHGSAVLRAMVAGGMLWIFHGYFRFMTPQGPDAVWREDLRYSPRDQPWCAFSRSGTVPRWAGCRQGRQVPVRTFGVIGACADPAGCHRDVHPASAAVDVRVGTASLAFGTAVFALFGAGWVVLGFSLRHETVRASANAYA